jgi:hypothetical protein
MDTILENPTLEIDVRLEEGPEVSAPVDDKVCVGDCGGGDSE